MHPYLKAWGYYVLQLNFSISNFKIQRQIQRGGQGVQTPPPPPPPPKNYKNIGFLSNAGPDPLKNHKITKHSMLGHHWPTSEMPF